LERVGTGREKTIAVAGLILVILIASSAYLIYLFISPAKPFAISSIGVINLYGAILTDDARDYVTKMVDYTYQTESIKAVVLKVDCPGGWSDAVEEIYLMLLALREKKPVVASIIGIAASGGYYISVAADYIYAVPSSAVGNIGVIGVMPTVTTPSEDWVETGPYKFSGFSVKEFPAKVNLVLNTFVEAVVTRRGSKLLLNATDLSKGMLYFGKESLQYGLIDAIGSPMEAIQKAAEMANIQKYTVVEISSVIGASHSLSSLSSLTSIFNITLSTLRSLHVAPALYHLYLPTLGPELPGAFYSSSNLTGESTKGNRTVLIDVAHSNSFYLRDLNVLLSQIVFRNYTFRYFTSSSDLKSMLSNATAFVVISPMDGFSENEINAIKSFIEVGGKLLLIFDPSRASTAEINSLSSDFKIVFSNGYLYNLKEAYDNYKNIIVKEFKSCNITKGLNEIVFFTACNIYTTDGIAFTSSDTVSSESEKEGVYSTIAYVSSQGILAIGDQTFLTEPYCYSKDNYLLIQNIADFLAP